MRKFDFSFIFGSFSEGLSFINDHLLLPVLVYRREHNDHWIWRAFKKKKSVVVKYPLVLQRNQRTINYNKHVHGIYWRLSLLSSPHERGSF